MIGLIRGPREGWLTLLLVAAVVLSPALSLAEGDWVDDLWIVPWLAFFSVLLGTVLAKLPVRWAVAHLFAVQIGLGLVATYFAALPPRGDWEERFLWLWGRVWTWLEVAVGGGMSNDDMLFALLMALVAWLLGYLSAWSAFRSHSVWPVVVACGSGLLLNLSYGPPNALRYFLAFLLAAMLLLIRVTLFQRERDWDRADAEYNRGLGWSLLWRGGVLSIGIVAFAWTMPVGSVNASVAESWYRVTGPWQGLQLQFDRLFASVGSTNSGVGGNNFTKTLALKGAIDLGPELVMLVSSPRPEYWGAQAYDRYTGQGWMSSAEQSTRLDANDRRLAATSMYQGRWDIEQRFALFAGRVGSVFAAGAPVRLGMPVYADHFDSLDDLAALRWAVPLRQGQQYAVISSVSVASVSQLREAGADYPEWTGRYLELPQGTVRRVAGYARRATRDAENPYDAAVALEQYLRGFRYETKIASPPPDRDAVDWFLRVSQEGYCDYFASAMAVLARTIGIPSRVVAGYATGTFNEGTGFYEVRRENAHSWPELFFPGNGWVRFEPTPSQPTPQRPEVAPEEMSSGADLADDELEALGLDTIARDRLLLDDDLDLLGDASTAGGAPWGTIDWSRAVLPATLLAGAATLWLVWRRVRSRLSAASRAYLQMYWTAGLLGWRLRPSHTPGEYARVLWKTSPDLRPDVEAIVACYVEETYGGRAAAADDAATRSWGRIRLKLPLRLLSSAIGRRRSA